MQIGTIWTQYTKTESVLEDGIVIKLVKCHWKAVFIFSVHFHGQRKILPWKEYNQGQT